MMALALLLSGCALMDAEDCAKANWAELGRRDAEGGHLLSERLERRRQICEQAGARVDALAYETGHQDGKQRYCSPTRGQQDALNGKRPASLCLATREYDDGFNQGLARFCTARAGFEHARQGGSNPGTCPPAWAPDFDTGWRFGHEHLQSRQRLDTLDRRAVSLVNALKDEKLAAKDREALRRELEAVEHQRASLRRQLRGLEIDALRLPQQPR